MKKLTELQIHRLQVSKREANSVLIDLKSVPNLKGKDLERMKSLEVVVQHLEILLIDFK